jgi:hypothetical protein
LGLLVEPRRQLDDRVQAHGAEAHASDVRDDVLLKRFVADAERAGGLELAQREPTASVHDHEHGLLDHRAESSHVSTSVETSSSAHSVLADLGSVEQILDRLDELLLGASRA